LANSRHREILLFDRASGELKRRFGDLPNVVLHLAYSPDGRRLAASLGGSNGVRVFDAQNGYQLLPSDTQYKGQSYWGGLTVPAGWSQRHTTASSGSMQPATMRPRSRGSIRMGIDPGRPPFPPTALASRLDIRMSTKWWCFRDQT
jgi:hypothetical protein